jgi:hypothetical protein
MPIGSNADYAVAGIKPANLIWADEDIIILTPAAPLVPVMEHNAGWNQELIRCESLTGRLLRKVPVPADFFTDPFPLYTGVTPNHACAILLSDYRTLYQSQPFHRCSGNGDSAVTQYDYPSLDIYGDGIAGAHGGSGLSSIGGTIRLGELVSGGNIPHALKLTIYCLENCYYALNEPDGKPGYRWPASKSDDYADTAYHGSNQEVQMGSLLALSPSFDINDLETEPGRIIAHAMQDYGAYIADDAAWDCYYIATEWSPDGRVLNEFKSAWGYEFFQATPESTNISNPVGNAGKWGKDMLSIFTNLMIVKNNTAASIGGGGVPIKPLAQELEAPVDTGVSNLVKNGDFSSDKDFWNEEIHIQDGYQASIAVEEGKLHAVVTKVFNHTDLYKVQVKQIIERFEADADYLLSFKYKGNIPSFNVQIMNNDDPYNHLGLYKTIIVETGKECDITLRFTSITQIPAIVRLSFEIGSDAGEFFLDDVSLTKDLPPYPVQSFAVPYLNYRSVRLIAGNGFIKSIEIPKKTAVLCLKMFDLAGRCVVAVKRNADGGMMFFKPGNKIPAGRYVINMKCLDDKEEIIESKSTSVFYNGDK